jgi:hypothetical protein
MRNHRQAADLQGVFRLSTKSVDNFVGKAAQPARKP